MNLLQIVDVIHRSGREIFSTLKCWGGQFLVRNIDPLLLRLLPGREGQYQVRGITMMPLPTNTPSLSPHSKKTHHHSHISLKDKNAFFFKS